MSKPSKKLGILDIFCTKNDKNLFGKLPMPISSQYSQIVSILQFFRPMLHPNFMARTCRNSVSPAFSYCSLLIWLKSFTAKHEFNRYLR